MCSITKRRRDLSKVNVFYDIRRTWITRQGMFEDTRTEITKGVKVFDKPVARTDAEIWLAQKKAEFDPFKDKNIIEPRLTNEDRRQDFFSEMHRKWPGYDYFEFHYSVENIRIEHREVRDLKQDLADVADGIKVVHDIDRMKAQAAKKRADREKRQEAEKQRRKRKAVQKRKAQETEQLSLF